MYSESKQYLINKLREAGLRSKPYTTEKALLRCLDSHMGAVLFESESISRNGSKTRFRDQTGAQKKRRKIYDRGLAYTVTIGDYTDEAVEAMYERFLGSLDPGIMIDGNYVEILPEGADWVDDDDSILKAKVAVQIKIRFLGGVYKDTGFTAIKEIVIEGVSKDAGKEPIDGN